MTDFRFDDARVWRRIAAVVLFLLAAAHFFFTAPAAAQQGQPEPPAVTEKPAGPGPIPASQISIKAEETSATVESLKDRPAPREAIQKLAPQIAAGLERYERMFGETETSLAGSLSFRELQDLERRWHRARELVEAWQSEVRVRARSIDRDLETLQSLRKSWELTLSTADEARLQEVHIEVARGAVRSVGELEARFAGRRAELLTLQGQITRAEQIIQEALRQISAAKNNVQSQMAAFDAPPLWSVLIHPPPRTDHVEPLLRVWNKSRSDLAEFIRHYQKVLTAFALIYIGLLALFYYLRRRMDRPGEAPKEFESSLLVLARPISTSLVVGLTLMLLLFPEAPRTADDVVLLILFFPLFRILPPALTGRFRGALVALVVTTVFSEFADVLPYSSPLQRLVVLGISVIALIVIARLLRRNEPEQESTRRSRVLPTRPIGWIALLAVITAIVMNILGDVSLANLLTTTVIMAAYLALLLYALYFIAVGVLWVGLGTEIARRLRIVQLHEDVVRLRILTILRIGFAVFWIIETTKFVNLFSPFEGSVHAILTAKAKFGEVGISLGDILAFAVTIWVAFWVSRFLRFVLEEDVFPRLTLPRGVPQAISTGIHYVVLLFGFFLAVAATGIELSRFTLLAGAFGVGVGFGLQNVIHNFVSGLILLIERPIMPGDTIQMGDLAGEVKRIGMRSSTVRTWKGAEVIVPNGHLISNEVINWTLSDRQRRIEINVGVAYGTDPQRVVALLQDVGASHPEVLKHPPPYVLFLGFGDSSLNFELRVWTVEFDRFLRIQSEITIAVEKTLKEAGITIPFPQRDVHLIPPAKTPRPTTRSGEDVSHPPTPEFRSGPGDEGSSAESSDPEV